MKVLGVVNLLRLPLIAVQPKQTAASVYRNGFQKTVCFVHFFGYSNVSLTESFFVSKDGAPKSFWVLDETSLPKIGWKVWSTAQAREEILPFYPRRHG